MDSPLFNYRFLRDPDEESVDLLGGVSAAVAADNDAPGFDSVLENGGLPGLTQPSVSSEDDDNATLPSPATQTLNQLSQDRSDLRYDHSQLARDVALAQREKQGQKGGTHCTSSSSPYSALRRTPPASPSSAEPVRNCAPPTTNLPLGDAGRSAKSQEAPIRRRADSTVACGTAGGTQKTRGIHSKGRPVAQIDAASGTVLRRFASLTEAESVTGVRRHFIRRVMQHPGQTAGGFQWRECSPESPTGGAVQRCRSHSPREANPARTLAGTPNDPFFLPGSEHARTKSEGIASSSRNKSPPSVEQCSDAPSAQKTDPETPAGAPMDQSYSTGTASPSGGDCSTAHTPLDCLATQTSHGNSNSRCSETPKLPTPRIKSLSDGFSVHTIVIDREGPLRMVIAHGKAPPSLLSALGIPSTDSENGAPYCGFVRSFNADRSLARDCGLRPNDIFLCRSSPERVALMPYLEVIDRAKHSQRPLTFLVARHRPSDSISIAGPSNSPAKSPHKIEPTARQNPSTTQLQPPSVRDLSCHNTTFCTPQNAQENTGRPSTNSEASQSLVVPFCTKCQTGQARMHHAWCPQHPHFRASGAHEVLSRIRWGAEALGCPTCLHEYQRGRRSKAPHSTACRNRECAPAAQLQNANKRKVPPSEEVGLSPSKRGRGKVSRRSTTGDDLGVADGSNCKIGQQSAHKCDTSVEPEYDSDSTGYRPPRRSAVPPTAASTSFVELSKKRRTVTATSLNMRQKESASGYTKSIQQQQQGPSRAITPNESDAKNRETDGDVSGTEIVDIVWEPSDDPWGPDGYQEGDVVLSSGRAKGLGHVETVLPSLRFEIDPFVSSKLYSKTHCTPEEGFQVLELRRDPLGRLDWGFSVARHDFGGACLVDRVTPMSPASSAVYLAASTRTYSSSGLRVNDMLICLNGKRVGGMMETELAVELEISGPRLMLIISRCKREDTQETKIWEAERYYQRAVDKALNDRHRLGWIDLVAHTRPRNAPFQASSTFAIDDNVEVETPTSPCTFKSIPGVSNPFTSSKVNPTGARVVNFPQKYAQVEDMQGQIDSISTEPEVPPELTITSSAGRDIDVGTSAISRSSPCAYNSEPARMEADCVEHDQQDNESEYENAWMGCVCGVVHEKSVPVFWIQCDFCHSWYNVSSQCVSFEEKDAEDLPSWTCWGCPSSDSPETHKNGEVAQPSEVYKIDDTIKAGCCISGATGMDLSKDVGSVSENPVGPYLLKQDESPGTCSAAQSNNKRDITDHLELSSTQRKGTSKLVTAPNQIVCHQDEPTKAVQQIMPSNADSTEHHFSRGEIVYVRDYGPKDHGVAYVLQSHVDERGNRFYDVKFIVGWKCKGIPAQFVTLHHF